MTDRQRVSLAVCWTAGVLYTLLVLNSPLKKAWAVEGWLGWERSVWLVVSPPVALAFATALILMTGRLAVSQDRRLRNRLGLAFATCATPLLLFFFAARTRSNGLAILGWLVLVLISLGSSIDDSSFQLGCWRSAPKGVKWLWIGIAVVFLARSGVFWAMVHYEVWGDHRCLDYQVRGLAEEDPDRAPENPSNGQYHAMDSADDLRRACKRLHCQMDRRQRCLDLERETPGEQGTRVFDNCMIESSLLDECQGL